MATAAGMEAATAGAAMAEGMAVATEAAENADIIGIILAPPMCRTMQFGSRQRPVWQQAKTESEKPGVRFGWTSAGLRSSA
jgi:hypothetical protein